MVMFNSSLNLCQLQMQGHPGQELVYSLKMSCEVNFTALLESLFQIFPGLAARNPSIKIEPSEVFSFHIIYSPPLETITDI